MGITEEMKRVAEEIVSSYQSKICEVGIIVDNTYQLLEDFKTKRDQMSNQLKETLAKEDSLRKKDFDNMMKDILFYEEQRERRVRSVLKTFFEEQKEIAETIRRCLEEGSKIGIEDFKKMLEDIKARQGLRESEVRAALKEFQKEYKEMAESLRGLLNKRETARIKDFKEMIKNIRLGQIGRTEEERTRLDEFRRNRQDMVSQRNNLTVTMAKKADSLRGGETEKKEKAAKV